MEKTLISMQEIQISMQEDRGMTGEDQNGEDTYFNETTQHIHKKTPLLPI